jgi:hypothetical protein
VSATAKIPVSDLCNAMVETYTNPFRHVAEIYRDCIQRKTWRMGPSIPYFTLSQRQLRSQISTPTAKGKRWDGEDLSNLVEHICPAPITNNRKRESTAKGEERGES